MQTPIADLRGLPATLTLPLSFARWYYGEMPVRIVKAYREYALAFWEMFAFFFLLKTLLAPWKNITDPYPRKGFNIGKIAETFTLNVTARVIGLIFRLVTIMVGLVVQACALIAAVVWLVFWLGYPLILLVAIPYLLGFFF